MTENDPKPHSLQTTANVMDEGALTKGQLRKLNALRKSVGEEIGERGGSPSGLLHRPRWRRKTKISR